MMKCGYCFGGVHCSSPSFPESLTKYVCQFIISRTGRLRFLHSKYVTILPHGLKVKVGPQNQTQWHAGYEDSSLQRRTVHVLSGANGMLPAREVPNHINIIYTCTCMGLHFTFACTDMWYNRIIWWFLVQLKIELKKDTTKLHQIIGGWASVASSMQSKIYIMNMNNNIIYSII